MSVSKRSWLWSALAVLGLNLAVAGLALAQEEGAAKVSGDVSFDFFTVWILGGGGIVFLFVLPNEVASIPIRDLPEVSDPLVGPPVLNMSPEGHFPSGDTATPNIGLEFSGRQEGIKRSLLRAYGGTALTEDAVKDGLRWLAKQQRPRGSWRRSEAKCPGRWRSS